MIITNELYTNKTLLYLSKILKYYDLNFVIKFNKTKILALGVNDLHFTPEVFPYNELIFVLIDSSVNIKDFVEWDDYIHSTNILYTKYMYGPSPKSTLVMYVIKVPIYYKKSYFHFLMGDYSFMYDINDKIIYSKKEEIGDLVLRKDTKALLLYKNTLKDELNVNIQDTELLDHEFDTPPKCNEEMFNCTLKGTIRSYIKEK